jgi:hypothetical protein
MRRESRTTGESSTTRPSVRDSLCGIVLAAFVANAGCGANSTAPESGSAVSILAKKRIERAQGSPDTRSKGKSR